MAEEGRKQNRSRERAIVLNYLSHDSVFPFGNPVLPFEAKNVRRRGKLGSRREIFDAVNWRETIYDDTVNRETYHCNVIPSLFQRP